MIQIEETINVHLNILSECSKQLFADFDGSDEVELASFFNSLFARVVPVEVHHRLLNTQQVIHRTDDQINCCVITYLGPQVILPVWNTEDAYRCVDTDSERIICSQHTLLNGKILGVKP